MSVSWFNAAIESARPIPFHNLSFCESLNAFSIILERAPQSELAMSATPPANLRAKLSYSSDANSGNVVALTPEPNDLHRCERALVSVHTEGLD